MTASVIRARGRKPLNTECHRTPVTPGFLKSPPPTNPVMLIKKHFLEGINKRQGKKAPLVFCERWSLLCLSVCCRCWSHEVNVIPKAEYQHKV
jgi:hypothetical protein